MQQDLAAQQAAAARANTPAAIAGTDAANMQAATGFDGALAAAQPSGIDQAQKANEDVADAKSGLVDANIAPAPQLSKGRAAAEAPASAAGHAVTGAAGFLGKIDRDLWGHPWLSEQVDAANKKLDAAVIPDPGRASELGIKVAETVGGMAPLLPLAAWSPVAAAVFAGMGGANNQFEKTEAAQAEKKRPQVELTDDEKDNIARSLAAKFPNATPEQFQQELQRSALSLLNRKQFAAEQNEASDGKQGVRGTNLTKQDYADIGDRVRRENPGVSEDALGNKLLAEARKVESHKELINRWLGAVGGFTIGAAQMAPFSRLLGRVEAMQPGSVIGSVAQAAKNGAQTSVEQVLVQSLSTVGENGIHKLLADKDQGLLEGVQESAAVAAIVGGSLGLAGGFYGSAAARRELREHIERSTPDELDAFIYKAQGGKSTREEVDEALRRKEAADAAKEAQSAPALAAPADTTPPPTKTTQESRQAESEPAPAPSAPESHIDKNPPAADGVLSMQDETLRALGHDDEEIALMSPGQRAAILAEAKEAGVTPQRGSATPASDEVNAHPQDNAASNAAPEPVNELPPGFKFADEPAPAEQPEERYTITTNGQTLGVRVLRKPDGSIDSYVLDSGHLEKASPRERNLPAEEAIAWAFGDHPQNGQADPSKVKRDGAPAEQPGNPASAPSAPSAPGEPATPATPAKPSRETPPRQPQTLLSFIKAGGGIKDVGGNLRAAGLHRYPGLINNKSGMDPDRAREAAAEGGYLGADRDHAHSNTTPDDLTNALLAHPTYSSFDGEELAKWKAHTGSKEQREKDLAQAEKDIHAEQRNDDPRRITPAQNEAAFSPAGEPFHTIAISKPKAGAEPTKPVTEAVQGTEKAGEMSPLAKRVLEEMSKTVGQRGYLADLRKAFPDVPRAELDKALIEVHLADNNASLMGMDNPRDKRAAESREAAVNFKGRSLPFFWVNEPKAEELAPAGQEEHSPFDPSKSVPDAVADYLYRGQAFADIRAARKFVKEHGGDGLDFKQTEENIEHGVVKAARAIVAESKTPVETYNRLVALYANQPKLATRTSTSVEQQAYSTPAPLAYVASQLAHITPETTVLEPTAGNGMLLIGAKPNMVLVNEINPERFAALKEQGFKASKQDATEYLVSSSNFDAVIANPPFGTVKDGFGTVDSPGRTKRFDLGDIQKGYSTAEIDHVIALKALRAMKDDGHAILILGGINKLVKTEEDRSNAYHGKAKREFFHVLYNRYNVTDHFTVAGEMYEKQGAGWPIDVIAINGRGKSALKLPSVNVPPVLRSWDELKEKLNVPQPAATAPSAEDHRPPGNAPDGTEPGGNAALAEGNNPDAGRGGPPAERPAGGPGKLRKGRDRGQPGNAGTAGKPSEPAVPPGTVQDADRPSGVAPAGGNDGVKPQAIRQEQETEGQSSYRPRSKSGVSLGTLVPRNLRHATEEALAKVAKGQTVDKVVAAKLGMSSNELGAYFAAEQVDALALALHNLEKGAGFIIGDQTGIGKGRVNAAIIRYAIKNDLTPIFVTEKPNLYGDMYRDLKDTGIIEYLGREPKILMTNANESIPLDDDGKMVLKTPDAKEHNDALLKIAAEGKLADHDMLFTTYNQMQQVKGASTPRTALLKALAPNAIVIFDESHNAGGTETGEQQIQAKNPKVSRADFARELVQQAKGVFYSSATYAKRPSVMSLYSKTDMAKAVDKPEDLAPAMQSGGVPMQQVVAAMLAESGQYIRRERSFAGITYDAKVVPTDHAKYKAFSGSIYAIHKFSESIKDAIKNIDKGVKESAQSITPDGSTGGAGANSTNFTAIMHNLVSQFLLSQKADIAVQEALAALKRGEKPVVTLANTMESFLKEHVEDHSLAPGDAISLSFKDLLERYLERTRTITIKRPFSKEKGVKRYLTDEELGPEGLARYKAAKIIIGNSDVGDLPVSPIDYMKDELARAGYKFGEITGRGSGISYAGKQPRYYVRSGKETSIRGRRKAITDFNKGDLHGIILNQSGATGLSLHASMNFKDQSRRHMIIVQAEANPDTHMQMLGRINRTGQTVLPTYTQIAADIPAELRYAAVLAKKMASLNASTTADRKGALSANDDSIDIMNKYGDQVAYNMMRENPRVNSRLGRPIDLGERMAEGAMRKLTGRIPLLDPKDQADLYGHLQTGVKNLIAEKEAAGENVLEAKRLDLDAKPISSMTVREGTGDNPFTQPVKLEILDVKRQSKPYFAKDLIRDAAESVELKSVHDDPSEALKQIEAEGKKKNELQVKAALDAFRPYAKEMIDEAETDAGREAIRVRVYDNEKRFADTMQVATVGRQVSLVGNDQNFSGIITKVARDGKAQNPLALGTWKVTVAIPGKAKVAFPFTRLYTAEKPSGHQDDDDEFYRLETRLPDSEVLKHFDEMSKDAREQRAMLTGNLLAAYAWKPGQIVNYTDHEGAVKQGVLLSSGIKSAEDAMAGRGIPIKTPEEVLGELKARGSNVPLPAVNDPNLFLSLDNRNGLVVAVPSSKLKGGDYFLNKNIRSAAGRDFIKRGSYMMLTVPAYDDHVAVIKAIMDVGAKFEKLPEDKPPTQAASMRNHELGEAKKLPNLSPELRAHIRNALDAAGLAQKVAGKHSLVDVAEELRVSRELSATSGGTGELAFGLFTSSKRYGRLIQIAFGTGVEKDTAYHEGFHALEDADVFHPQEKAVLNRETPRLRQIVQKDLDLDAKALAGMPDTEIRAYAFEKYAREAEGRNPNAGAGLHIGIRRIFDKVLAFFRRLRNSLEGNGFKNADDVFERARSGEAGQREAGPRDYGIGDNFTAAKTKKSTPGRRRYYEGEGILDKIKRKIANGIDLRRIEENTLDFNAPVRHLQGDLQDAGHTIGPGADTYTAKRLLQGRTTARNQDFDRDHLLPLVKKMGEIGASEQDVGEYMNATHAPERNAQMDLVDPNNNGRGSGTDNAEAQRILNELDRDGLLKPIQNEIEPLIEGIRDYILTTRVNGGLISQQQADDLRNMYQHYAPLQGWETPDQVPDHAVFSGGGGKFSVRGPETKHAFGRRSASDNPLANLISQARTAIERSEKNAGVGTMWRLLKSLPKSARDDIALLDKGHSMKVLDTTTGQMFWIPEPGWRNRKDVVTFKIGGKPHYMVFHDEHLAEAINRIHADQLVTGLKTVGSFVNLAKNFFTHYSPTFIFRHFFMRYPVEAALNAAEDGFGAMFRTFKGYPGGSMFRALVAADKMSTPDRAALAQKVSAGTATKAEVLQHRYHQLRAAGGLSNFSDFAGVEATKKRLDVELARTDASPVRRAVATVRAAHKFVEHMTSSLDHAQRLAAFVEAMDHGATVKEATMKAREATIDFALKGRFSKYINLMWPFGNAAAQTASRMIRAQGRSGRMRWMLAGVMAMGAANALFNYLYGGNDKDGIPFYEKVAEWTRRLNMVFMLPFGDQKGRPYYGTLAMPYNYAAPMVVGTALAQLALKQMGIAKEPYGAILKNVIHSVLESLTPATQENSMLGKITPEVLRPFLHVAINENFAGFKIYKDADSGLRKGIAHAEQGKPHTAEYWKSIAKGLNNATGGSKYESGLVDLPPEAIREVAGYLTANQESTIRRTGELIDDLAHGRRPQPNDIEISRSAIGGDRAYDQADTGAFYEDRKKAYDAEASWKKAGKENPKEAQRMMKANGADIAAATIYRSATKQLSTTYQEEDRLHTDKRLSPDEIDKRQQKIEADRLRIMNTARTAVEKRRADAEKRRAAQ